MSVRRDIPAVPADAGKAKPVLDALREFVQTSLGYRGDPLDQVLTYRDITPQPDGTVVISPGGGSGGGGTPIVINPGGVAEEPDLTPPPTPTGLTVTAGLTELYVSWDGAVYSAGHGPKQANLYGTTWPEDDLSEPTFADAVLVGAAPHALSTYVLSTEPATRWCLWLKFETVDGVVSTTPAGGAHGVQATTSPDVSQLLEILSGQITNSQLHTDLATPIALITAPASTPGSVDARVQVVQTAATAAQTTADGAVAANAATAALVTTVQSQVNQAAGMIPLRSWGFDSGTDGWLATTATLTIDSGTLVWAPTGANATFAKTFLLAERFNGAGNTLVRARVKRLSGTGAWEGSCYYQTAGHTNTNLFRKIVAAPARPDEWNLLEWDMAALTAGGSDWVDNEIQGLRIDLVSDAGSTWAIDYVQVGAPSNLPLAASVQQEITTRASETGYLGAQYTMRIDVGGKVGGFGVAGTSAPGAQPTIDAIFRVDKFGIAPPSGSALPDILPFVVQTTSQVVNGVTIPAGVYMDAAYIKNLQALTARLGNAWITNAMVANLDASKLTVGSGIVGGNLRSTNYVGGTSGAGWILQPNGFAEFSNVQIRNATYTGSIFAGSGTIGGCEINVSDIRSTNFVTGSSGAGWRLTSAGAFEVTNGTFRGTIIASNGTIGAIDINATDVRSTNYVANTSGFMLQSNGNAWFNNITAKGNITANSLDAATGTFSGTLTAAAVNAVDTINLAGNAVTVPASAEVVSAQDNLTGGYQTVCQATVNTEGQPCIVIGLFRVAFASGGGTCNVRILIDGSEERMLVLNSTTGGLLQDVTLIALKASPVTGNFTVRLQASASSNVTRVEPGSALVALGCKR